MADSGLQPRKHTCCADGTTRSRKYHISPLSGQALASAHHPDLSVACTGITSSVPEIICDILYSEMCIGKGAMCTSDDIISHL